MKRMFEAVFYGGAKLFWDYRLHNMSHYKGYYHWHQSCEMLYVHEGAGRVVVAGETWPIRRGMLFFFRPYQLHHVYASVSAEQPYTRTIFHFDPQLADDLLKPFSRRHALMSALCRGRHKMQAFDLVDSAQEAETLLASYNKMRQQSKGDDSEEIALLLLRLIDLMMCITPGETRRPFEIVERRAAGYAQDAMQWIDEHYQESIRLEDLAEALHLSKFYLSKLFNEEIGTKIKDYVTAKRMRHACRLLETTSKSVEFIGSEVGFPNSSYFVQVFKQEVGITPHKYRTTFIESVRNKGVLR